MGFVKAWFLTNHNPWIVTSATLHSGAPMDNVCELLELQWGKFHIIHRSNLCPEIQLLFCELSSPIKGDSFPELQWVLTSNRSTLIFAKTITLSHCIWADLIRQDQITPHAGVSCAASNSTCSKHICMYNSLNWESYNAVLMTGILSIWELYAIMSTGTQQVR